MIVSALAVLLVPAAAGVLVDASMQPAKFRVERSITIDAKPSAIFPYVNEQKKSLEWSPWAGTGSEDRGDLRGAGGRSGAGRAAAQRAPYSDRQPATNNH